MSTIQDSKEKKSPQSNSLGGGRERGSVPTQGKKKGRTNTLAKKKNQDFPSTGA